jgi:hypothetical protein
MIEMSLPEHRMERVIKHVNRKRWWHVPPADPNAYGERGKFFASSFADAEFWGRPMDEPQKVSIASPLVGDEAVICRALGVPAYQHDMTLEQIAARDATWRSAALSKGFDSILLMAPGWFAQFIITGKLPRHLELNILTPGEPEKGTP